MVRKKDENLVNFWARSPRAIFKKEKKSLFEFLKSRGFLFSWKKSQHSGLSVEHVLSYHTLGHHSHINQQVEKEDSQGVAKGGQIVVGQGNKPIFKIQYLDTKTKNKTENKN